MSYNFRTLDSGKFLIAIKKYLESFLIKLIDRSRLLCWGTL